MAFALNNVSSNRKNHIICERVGAVQPLIKLTHEKDSDVALQAVIALRNLAETAKNRIQVGSMGGLEPLMKLSDSDNIEVRREVAACYRNLSLSEEGVFNCVFVFRGVCVWCFY